MIYLVGQHGDNPTLDAVNLEGSGNIFTRHITSVDKVLPKV